MKYETAGDPMTTRKWTRKATRKVSRELKKVGIAVSRGTVGRLLTQLNYRLRVNWKKKSRGSPKERDRQFRRIFAIRQHFESNGLPVISVDTKKKELVGNFKNAGVAWTKAPFIANDHDFRSDAIGVAWPQGIFDTGANRGFVAVGTSHATPSFAADALVRWWENDGASRYPGADHILVLADAGGCNGPRNRAWKYELQRKLCDPFRLTVSVSHYPPGASKGNPIEHRLFSQISRNWAGRPLDSYATILNYIRGTETEKGLVVDATLIRRYYPTGVKVDANAMASVNLTRGRTLPQWNYTISPH